MSFLLAGGDTGEIRRQLAAYACAPVPRRDAFSRGSDVRTHPLRRGGVHPHSHSALALLMATSPARAYDCCDRLWAPTSRQARYPPENEAGRNRIGGTVLRFANPQTREAEPGTGSAGAPT
jgi:hypothetical protein